MNHEFEFTTYGLYIAAQGREVHIRLSFNFGNRWLLDFQGRSDIGLSLARNLTELSQAFDFLLQFLVACIDPMLPLFGKRIDHFINCSAHVGIPRSTRRRETGKVGCKALVGEGNQSPVEACLVSSRFVAGDQ